jgi:hypothetical protein
MYTATAETCEKLRLAKDLLRHANPDVDIADVVDRAVALLLEGLAKKKFAATARPRPSRETTQGVAQVTRHIPAAVKRTVWLRDGGRCAFLGGGGRRCKEHHRTAATGTRAGRPQREHAQDGPVIQRGRTDRRARRYTPAAIFLARDPTRNVGLAKRPAEPPRRGHGTPLAQ